jgi:hypothetical protein
MNLAAAGILVNISAQAAERGARPLAEPMPKHKPGRSLTFGTVGARGFAGGRR